MWRSHSHSQSISQTFPSFICLIPAIILGTNQAIRYALFMVVIIAFIGTTDLGQEMFRSKADNNADRSLVVGLCASPAWA